MANPLLLRVLLSVHLFALFILFQNILRTGPLSIRDGDHDLSLGEKG